MYGAFTPHPHIVTLQERSQWPHPRSHGTNPMTNGLRSLIRMERTHSRAQSPLNQQERTQSSNLPPTPATLLIRNEVLWPGRPERDEIGDQFLGNPPCFPNPLYSTILLERTHHASSLRTATGALTLALSYRMHPHGTNPFLGPITMLQGARKSILCLEPFMY